MAIKSPDQMYAEWKKAMDESAEKYRTGINAVTESPMEKAANSSQKWADGVAAAARDGRFAAGLRSVSLADWKKAAVDVGASRLADGARKAQRKMIAFWRDYGPVLQSVTDQVRAMPSGTYAERKARAMAMMDRLHEQPYKKSN